MPVGLYLSDNELETLELVLAEALQKEREVTTYLESDKIYDTADEYLAVITDNQRMIKDLERCIEEVKKCQDQRR